MGCNGSKPVVNLRTAAIAHRLLLQSIFFLFLCSGGCAQDAAAPQLAEYPFLLRLERTSKNSNVCVLLQRTGDFHLEHTRGDQTLVREGRIAEAELLRLKQSLDSDALQRLAQANIVPPLLSRMEDRLQINIFRADHWQNLVFPDTTSQAPHREVLTPLISWLNAIHDLPHRELSEDEGKNNCLPPKRLQLKIRSNDSRTGSSTGETDQSAPGSGAADAATAPSTRQIFLLRYSRERVSNGALERSCVIVNRTGHFRMEKGSQPATFKMKTTVYEGSISADEVRDLGRLLDAPDLKSLQHQNRILSVPAVQDAEVISLSIPRENDTQLLIFSGYVGIRSGKDSAPGGTDDTTSIAPIQKWLEVSIESRKLTPSKSALPDNCAAAP